ncbi:MAG: hypothetical protein HYT93_03790 [Parcubacteria group bacterium]|nr:hypothetical protein [Parcubacteria group bacterium]
MKIIRLTILLILSLVVNFWLFSYIQKSTEKLYFFDGESEFSSPPIIFEEILNNISPAIQIPFPLMKFNVYATNNVEDTSDEFTATTTGLNIQIFGKYSDNILTGNTEQIFKNFSPYLSNLSFERSFKTSTGNTPEKIEGHFRIFLKPTVRTFFLILLLIITPVVYGFIRIFSSCLRFVLIGSPFTEVLTEFKKRQKS